MKTFIQHTLILSTVAVLIPFMPCDSASQDSQTNHASQLTYGQLTNRIRAGIKVDWIANNYKPPEITVFVADTDADYIFGGKNLGTNWMGTFVDNLQSNHWLYFEPTNSFCGPIELVSATGQKVTLVKLEVSSLEAYPASYSLNVERSRHLPNEPTVSLRPLVFPLPLTAPTSKTAEFRLEDYFAIKEPGNYQLTVWPKIYKRASTNDDICERIDLPPVTVTIKWDGITNR